MQEIVRKLLEVLERNLYEQYANMNARARAPYETKAAKDKERYRREVDRL